MNRETLDIRNDWRFKLGDVIDAHRPGFDDSDWRVVSVPHDFSIEGGFDPCHPAGRDMGFLPSGVGWYRRRIAVPENWHGKKVWLYFDGIYRNAEVWVDGIMLRFHPYGYTPFFVDMSERSKPGGENIVAVRVDNSLQSSSRWYSGSGIYRDVALVAANRVHTSPWNIFVKTREISADCARVEVEVENETQNPADIEVNVEIIGPDGKNAGAAKAVPDVRQGLSAIASLSISVKEPRLWSCETPELYTAVVEIKSEGRVMDTVRTLFGIRTISFDAAHGFRLNGVPMKMRGGCVHHDNGPLGASAFRRAEERKVQLLKAAGFNAVRCSHNPPSSHFLDVCDREGMLVIDEAFDCWVDGKNRYDYHIFFEGWWRKDIEAMVRRDRNHPCVVMWSAGNEVKERGLPEGAAIVREIRDYIIGLDPTRPVTIGSQGCGAPDHDNLHQVFNEVDVAGYNYLYHIYLEHHEKYPERVMYGSESVAGKALENWRMVEENPWVIGDFTWTAMDYIGETGVGRVEAMARDAAWNFYGDFPWTVSDCGDLDICGFRTPQSYYRNIVWKTGPKLYTVVHRPPPREMVWGTGGWSWPAVESHWNWAESDVLDIEVYSACAGVELLLNGRSLGRKETSIATGLSAVWEKVPFTPGRLTAVGYDEHGVKTDEFVLNTTGAPSGLRLIPDRCEINADGFDLAYVTVEVIDSSGNCVPVSDLPVRLSAEGQASIIGAANGDPRNTVAFHSPVRKVFQGRALCVLRSGGNPGKAVLRAESDGLEPAEISLAVRF